MKRFQKQFFFWFVIIFVIGTAVWYWRRSQTVPVAPLLALCPGPDAFGYHCEVGRAFSYIDATNKLELYEDEGGKKIEFPFPIYFYGERYQSAIVGVNGTIHFGGDVATYESACLIDGILLPYGQFLAPYWDDLDSWVDGEIEYELVGEEPERIFVIEWDAVPLYEGESSRSFEVQFWETENQIIFLYQDIADGGKGAVIGIQSAKEESSLQYSCFQSALIDGQGLQFSYPNKVKKQLADWGFAKEQPVPTPKIRKDGVQFLNLLNQGVDMESIQLQWSQREGIRSETIRLGAGVNLIIRYEEIGGTLWLVQQEEREFSLLLQERIGARSDLWVPKLISSEDITADQIPDLLLRNEKTNQLISFVSHDGEWTLREIPLQCDGGVRLEKVIERFVIRGERCVGSDIVWWDGIEWVTNNK